MDMNKPISDRVFYRVPAKRYPVAARGEGIYLYDMDGKKYLDGVSSAMVCNIGHGVKEIAQVMAQQAAGLAFAHGSMFTTGPQEKLAEVITSLSPCRGSRVYFVSGGSEATETALKLARQYHLETGNGRKHRVITRWTSYHGSTMGALSMTGHVARRRMYDPYLLDFPHIPPAYCYRCPYDLVYPGCCLRCAHALEDAILRCGPENVSAFIAEPLVGSAAAAIHPPPGYFQIVRELCDQYELLMIVDEVMCGCGRTGRFFAIEHWNVVPDLIVVAKGLGSGYAPLGAVIASDEIHETIQKGSGRFEHGHTYQGNPLACAVGVSVLNYVVERRLIENAVSTGAYLLARLEDLGSRHAIVGDVRGKGLMLGMEFVKDKESKEPFPPERNASSLIATTAFNDGLIVYPGSGCADGVSGDHILIGPPLTIKPEECDILVNLLDGALTEVESLLLE